jgi:hypothetical protein
MRVAASVAPLVLPHLEEELRELLTLAVSPFRV